MAGHSKWANIKRRKGAQDAKRAKIFTRILKEIAIAVKEGGGPDVGSNSRLRLAVSNAKGVNMPKDNILRAIKKASDSNSESYEEVTYEGYGPGGIGLFVEATTDNINRTVSNVRAIFNKYGGSLGTNGSLEFIFTRKGVFTVPVTALGEMDMDEFEMELIDGGAEEVEREEDFISIFTSFGDFGNMQKKLEDLGIEAENQELQRIPNSTQALDIEDSKKILNIIEKFEEDEDVSIVFHNMEISDELAELI